MIKNKAESWLTFSYLIGIQCDIDLFKTVSYLRSQRSGMIQTEKQYQFLYSIINSYIDELNNRNQTNPTHRKQQHQQK